MFSRKLVIETGVVVFDRCDQLFETEAGFDKSCIMGKARSMGVWPGYHGLCCLNFLLSLVSPPDSWKHKAILAEYPFKFVCSQFCLWMWLSIESCPTSLLLSLTANWKRTSPSRGVLCHQQTGLFWLVLHSEFSLSHACARSHTNTHCRQTTIVGKLCVVAGVKLCYNWSK